MRNANSYSQSITLVICLISLVLSYSLLATFGLFFVAMVDEFHWTATAGSLGFAVSWLSRSIFSPLSGFSYSKFGIKKMTTVGAIILALGLTLSSTMSNQWQYVVYFGIIVSAGATTLGMSHSLLIPRWFNKKRGFAMGTVSTAYGLGPLIFFPVINASIEEFGWRSTLNFYAGVLLIFSILCALLIQDGPNKIQQKTNLSSPASPTWSLMEAVKSTRFWALVTMYIGGYLGYQMLVAHQVAHAESVGFSRESIILTLSIMGGFTLVGAIIGGWASDKLGRETVFFSSSVIGSLGILSFALLSIFPSNYTLLATFCIMGGLGFGMRLPLVLTIAADVFQGPLFPKLIGFLGIATAIGGFLGPLLAGFVFDLTGSYLPALGVSTVAMLTSGCIVWIVAPRKGLLQII